MRANEAPEKIYIHKSQYWGLMANEHNITKNGIEYTRTDAFIEKAVNWLQDNLVKETEVIASGCVSIRFNNVIEKFKQAMEE